MARTVLSFTLLILLSSANSFSGVNCEQLDATAQQAPGFHPPLFASAIGNNRIYFHSAPHSKCKENNIFVIKGDSVTVYTEYKQWLYIMFVNSKTGKDVMGWVQKRHFTVGGKIHE